MLMDKEVSQYKIRFLATTWFRHKYKYKICYVTKHTHANSVLKVVGYVKYEFKFFLIFKFLTGWCSVGRWSLHLVGGQLVGGRLVGGRLVGGLW